VTQHDARDYAADALLKDGTSIHVRAIRPDDKERLLDHFRRLGPESVRFRFFGCKKTLSDSELTHYTELDFTHQVGLVAVIRERACERFVGVARYFRCDGDPGGARRAEFALAVDDADQGRGVGSILLEHLAAIGLQSGIEEFECDLLGTNARMKDLLQGSGFEVSVHQASGVIHARFPTGRTDAFVRAADRRASQAAAASVRAFMAPRSVAVVGASRREGSIGHAVIRNLVDHGFQGGLFPVNPNATEVAGLPCWPSVRALPAPVDLCVIAVPAPLVEAAVTECAESGAHGVVVLTAGFAETSAEGAAAQGRLRDIARQSGLRLVGPNCMGVVNTDPTVRLAGTFAPVFPPAGNVGILSQSGALGLAVLDYAAQLNIGVSTFVSVGNKADVSGNDLLAYWKDDPRTDVIALYLESFGNPIKFARLAPEVARRKPIVAVKSGRSASGRRAAESHSAALGSLDVAVDALFEQAGVIRTDTLEDLFDVVALLATQPVPRGPRVGVVTNGGGPGILLADACEARGLALPTLAPATMAELRRFLPPHAAVKNPVDLIAGATPQDFRRAMGVVGRDPNVDAVVAIFVPPLVADAEDVACGIAAGAGEVPAEKPVLTVFLSSKGAPEVLAGGPRGRLPSYSFPENAARALAAAHAYGEWRERPPDSPLRLEGAQRAAVRRIFEQSQASLDPGGWMSATGAAELVQAAGIRIAEARVVPVHEAAQAAEALGFPVVLKAVAPGLVHKSDVGGVVLSLASPVDVASAASALGARLEKHGYPLERVLVQEEVRGGLEALVGVVVDPTFGPLVVCGLGGVQAELLRDVSFHLTPVGPTAAADMIGRLRLSALLDGYRGAPAGDRAALADVIQRVAALVEAVPEIRELDLNPVKVMGPGEGVVVVDARVRLEPAPMPIAVGSAPGVEDAAGQAGGAAPDICTLAPKAPDRATVQPFA
jgi:acetyl coenzyme A synthetase (ADP forming)-like protein